MATHARILVVEDDAALRAVLAEVLEEQGFAVSCAENGADALAQLVGDAAPSLILLDLAMPVMDGWAFRRAVRADPRFADVPTVVLSATHAPDLETLHPDAFLAKPFDVDQLMAAVRRLC